MLEMQRAGQGHVRLHPSMQVYNERMSATANNDDALTYEVAQPPNAVSKSFWFLSIIYLVLYAMTSKFGNQESSCQALLLFLAAPTLVICIVPVRDQSSKVVRQSRLRQRDPSTSQTSTNCVYFRSW
jgi:hypothetical protein